LISIGAQRLLASHNVGLETATVFGVEGDDDFIIIPFFHRPGPNPVEIRRRLDGKKFETGHKYKWSCNMFWQVTHVFALDMIQDGVDTCIVVEGFFDVMRLYDMGYRNVLATNGSRISRVHWEYLRPYKKIVHLPDNDFAGWIGARSTLEVDRAEVKLPPHGQDPDNMSESQLRVLLGDPPFGR